ncbi:MAG: 50S ribosomal protein L35 [Oligoflexia bacterium]|nr:50S ribosomal protein L35 [Oligoflexia bacterium]
MKMKTNKGAAKRLRVTGSGKVKRKGAYARHLLRHRSTKQKRALRRNFIVNSANMIQVGRLLPNG